MKKMASVDPYKLFTVKMDDKSFKLKEKQFTTVVLSWVFSLFPELIILVSDDGYVEIPNEEGYFTDVDNLLMWTTSGYSMTPTPAALTAAMMTSYSTSLLVLLGRISAEKQSPIYQASLFKHMRPLSVCALESDNYVNTSSGSSSAHSNHSVQPSASDYDNWWKYIEVCKWSDLKKQWKKYPTGDYWVYYYWLKMVTEDAFNGEVAVILETSLIFHI